MPLDELMLFSLCLVLGFATAVPSVALLTFFITFSIFCAAAGDDFLTEFCNFFVMKTPSISRWGSPRLLSSNAKSL